MFSHNLLSFSDSFIQFAVGSLLPAASVYFLLRKIERAQEKCFITYLNILMKFQK